MTKSNVQNLVQTDKFSLFRIEILIIRPGINRAAIGVGNRVFVVIGKPTPNSEACQIGQIFYRRFQIGTHPARFGTA